MPIATTLEPRLVSVTRPAGMTRRHRTAPAAIAAGVTLLVFVALAGATVLSAAPAAPVSSEQTVEQTATDGATRLARTVTESSTVIAPAPPASASPPVRRDGTLLWVDPLHLNGIAANMAISGDGNHVVGGWWLNNARVALYNIGGTGTPTWTFPISTSFFTPVDASNDGSVVTGTGRQDQLYAWDAGSSTPYCAVDHPIGFEGGLAITPDVGGAFGGSSNQSNVDSWAYSYDDDCTKRFGDTLPGQTQGGRFAADGNWLVVNSRTHAVVFDAVTGAVRDTVSIPGETQAAAGISGDGSILAVGGFSRRTYVFEWDGNAYAPLWNHFISGVTWITAIDVSDDGSTVMVGTLLIATPYGGKVVMYDVASGPTPLWEDAHYGDEVQSVALSADGSIGVAGSWGRQGGT
ncbi:MAG: WD40 repeat domain-containing protein, partial [Candidatus Eiseniibacteriota bacterium]